MILTNNYQHPLPIITQCHHKGGGGLQTVAHCGQHRLKKLAQVSRCEQAFFEFLQQLDIIAIPSMEQPSLPIRGCQRDQVLNGQD